MREFCFVFVGRLAFQHGAAALFVYLGLLSSVCQASDLGSTKITAVRSTVEHFDGTAKGAGDVGQSVTPGHSVSTKEQSLAELTADDKSIIRLGANSVFSYSSAERIVKLDKGTMLMHTPPGNGGATIDSGGVVGAISGTTFMLTASPAKCSDCGKELRVNDAGKVICRDHPNNPPASGGFALVVLEGSSVTKVTGPDGQTVAVAPGQMAVVGPKGSGAPAVYAVNLTQIARTSPLINAFPTPLPSMPQIMATAYQLQNQNLQTTGTSGVAISSSGQLLTAVSPPPNPFLQTFSLASNQPGQNNSSNPSNLANISTAAGGGGGGGSSAPTGVAPTGGGPSTGPTIPPSPSTPPNQGQNAVAANQPTPVVPLTVAGASVVPKVYDGTPAASMVGALLSGAVSSGVSLVNETTGTYADKNVGIWSVTTSMGLIGSDAANYSLTQPSLSGTITAKDITMSSSTVSKKYDGTTTASVTLGTLSGLVGTEQLEVSVAGSTGAGTFSSKDVGGSGTVSVTYQLADDLVSGGLVSNYNLTNPTESLAGAITQRTLTMTGTTIGSREYDGTTTAGTVSVGTVGNLVSGEALVITGAGSNFSSADVGTQNLTVSYTLGNGVGGKASNYQLASQSVGGSITRRTLTMLGTTIGSREYDGSTTAGTLTVGTEGNMVVGEGLVITGAAGNYLSADVGTQSSVVSYSLADGAGGKASNYQLAAGSATGVITAKGLSVTAPSIASKVYNGNATAGSLTLGTLSGFVGSETVTASGAAADYSSANVGTYNGVVVSYTLGNGSNGGLASNYSLAAGSATGVITAKDVTIASGSLSGKVYDGNTGAVVTAGSLSGLVVGENLGTTTAAGTFASKDVGTRNVAASYTLTDGANLASNYNLLNPTEPLSAAITAKGLAITAPSIASKKYDGTTASGMVTVGTLSGFVGSEIVTAAGSAANYSSANVGSYSSAVTYTLSDGSNGGLASNYSLAAGSVTGAITAKDLVVNAAGITVGKIHDGGTSINPATQVAIGLGALAGSSTGANDGNYIGTEAVTLAVDAAGTFERNLPGTMIPISTTLKLASGNAVNNNYTLRAQPTGLTGEITGTANLNQNGVGISVSSADYIHIRNTTASRMQDGLSISSATGSVLLENSSFDGWMQRSTPNQTISDGGATTFTFTETASTAVNSPVLRLKMEANDPANVDMNKQFMLLGDYQVLLRRDPNGVPGSGDEVAQTLFSFPGNVDDPSGIGSLAPSADLVIRDSASTQVKDLSWDTKEYSSLDGSGGALDSGNYAAVQGEFKGDNPASSLDIATSSGGAAGKWDVMVSDPILGGEGKVTDVRLKYNNNTKALIQGPNGVRLVNVIFEGMDEVEVGASLNDKVLMSGTLVSDPNIGKMVVKAGQTLEAQFASDATMREVRTSAGNAEILAGVVKDVSSPTGYSFISGPNRVLEMQTATIAGQLSLASHTIVFNNANITSGGVIDARTRDGMVNRTYGSVVPGTVSFMGANGNTFLNTANSASMSIANSGNIVSALSGGQMRENGVGGATVMNVGRVR